jgi:hypothetical protein
MKLVLAALAVAAASPALAQDAHAGHDMAAMAAADTKAAARLNLDTPIEVIVADPAGKAVLEADVPGVTTHEHYDAFKGMGLKQLANYAPDRLTAEVLAKTETDLAAIK